MLYRNGIWFKLIESGVSSKIVRMLQSMYSCVKSCVKANGSLSECFDSYMGVKQGEPLSPLLFIFFVNDMYENIQNVNNDVFTLDELQIYLLLFADDTVLFSYSKEGLQLLLNQLYDYCMKWGITVNIEKTVVMVFKSGNRHENIQIYYNNSLLKNVQTFTYLGVTLSSNGNFYQAQKALSNQALKALFSLNSLFDKVSLDVTEKLKLFDCMILPILSYGSEIWGFHKAPDIEKIHLKFLKQVLGVRQQTPNSAVFGEFGRFPLLIIRKVRIIKYWHKILKSPNSLLYRIMFLSDANGNLVNGWSKNVKTLLSDLGFSYLWNNVNIDNVQLKIIIQRIYDQYLQQWCCELNTFSKLESYNIFKSEFVQEKYLSNINNVNHRKALSRFRCSAHKLAIEEGRFRNIERNQRLCNKCNVHQIESEYHFLLVCPFYSDLRKQLLPKYYCVWPNINKFKSIMKTTQKSKIVNLAKFIYLATEKRSERN
jgi:hypothetical protein